MSGSSHGTCGGPDRDCQTRSQSRPGPAVLGHERRRLAQLGGVAATVGPALASIVDGMEWAVKTTDVARVHIGRVRASAARTASACGRT